jgi:hypothetical protein
MIISWLLLLSSIVHGGPPPSSAAPAVLLHAEALQRPWQLEGVGLGDTGAQVESTWGKPSSVASDEWQQDCETWSYKTGKNVGLCGGQVSFVQVTAAARKANLDGKVVAMAGTELRQALGKPEFEAEDGWGVVKGAEALKVFVDERGRLVSLDLFHDPCNV